MNPLKKHFRQPSIYIKLPSDGVFYTSDHFIKTENNEYPVFPMTALDEIAYRTPDALFNGSATVTVVESCFPAIKNGWNISGCDFDAILVGIRIASYGHQMDLDTECPHCGTENNFEVDLRILLDGMGKPNYEKPLDIGDLSIFFKPLTYKKIYETQLKQFEEQQKLQIIANQEMEGIDSNKKVEILNECLKSLTSLSVDAVVHCINFIKTDESVVTEEEYISEFIKNCDRETFTKIKNHLSMLRDSTEIKPIDITCQNSECKQQYQMPFTLDSSNFFG